MRVRRALAALLVAVGACGNPPALEVGRIGFSPEEIAGLDEDHLGLLIDLTAFGLATADRRLDAVVAPFVERDLRSLVLQRAAMEVGARSVGLDEDALRAAYEQDPDHELIVRHLVVISERWRPQVHRDSARARAAEALARIRAGEPFEDVVALYSDEPGAVERGGLLSPGRRGSWVADFWRAASALEPGAVSGVVQTEYGYHVLRLEERRDVPFEEARDDVLDRMVDFSDAFRRSTDWLDERAGGAAVDTAAVAEWQAGRDPGRPLVRWPDPALAPYTAAELDRYAVTMPPAAFEEWRRAPASRTAGSVETVARNRILLDQASAMGIEVTEAQRARVAEGWRERAVGWAAALGFSARMQDRAIRSQALAGVATHRQDALIAREEVRRLATRLRALYPVTLPADPSR